MAGELVTGDWQAQYGPVALGDGTPYDLVKIEGLLDLPEVRSADRVLLRRHGLLPGDDFLGGRAVALTLDVHADDPADLGGLLDALAAAFRVGQPEAPFVFQFPGVAGGGRRVLYARPRKRVTPITVDFLYGTATVALEVFATDPRIYDATEQVGTSALPSAGGGLTFPLTFPLTFGAVSTGGTIRAENHGTFPTSPVCRIDGPVLNPRLENLTTGEVLSLDIDIPAGQFLVIDVEERTVLLGGTASRYSSLTSDSSWWELQPGTTDVTFRASTSSEALLTMTWRSAWA